jgi:hypothetical protein
VFELIQRRLPDLPITDLEEMVNTINKTERDIAKFKLSGTKVKIKYVFNIQTNTLYPRIDDISNIDDVNITESNNNTAQTQNKNKNKSKQQDDTITFNCSSINNGKLLLGINLLKQPNIEIDIASLDLTIQPYETMTKLTSSICGHYKLEPETAIVYDETEGKIKGLTSNQLNSLISSLIKLLDKIKDSVKEYKEGLKSGRTDHIGEYLNFNYNRLLSNDTLPIYRELALLLPIKQFYSLKDTERGRLGHLGELGRFYQTTPNTISSIQNITHIIHLMWTKGLEPSDIDKPNDLPLETGNIMWKELTNTLIKAITQPIYNDCSDESIFNNEYSMLLEQLAFISNDFKTKLMNIPGVWLG